jgi:hypothetical protein
MSPLSHEVPAKFLLQAILQAVCQLQCAKPVPLSEIALHEISRRPLPICRLPTLPQAESFTEVWGLDRSLSFCGSDYPKGCDTSAKPYPAHSIVAFFALVLRSRSFQDPMVVESNGKDQSCNAMAILRAFRWGETECHACCSVGRRAYTFHSGILKPCF